MKEKPRSSTEPIVNGWMFFRYLVIGVYVGLATVLGFIWWYLYYVGGPQVSWYDLTHFHSCKENCAIYHDLRPSTVSLSILVTIEMFNACNALSENESILIMPPWRNIWLIGAIALSFTLHFSILYIPFFSTLFGVAPLNLEEWIAVFAFSVPVIFIDEFLKMMARMTSMYLSLHCTSAAPLQTNLTTKTINNNKTKKKKSPRTKILIRRTKEKLVRLFLF